MPLPRWIEKVRTNRAGNGQNPDGQSQGGEERGAEKKGSKRKGEKRRASVGREGRLISGPRGLGNSYFNRHSRHAGQSYADRFRRSMRKREDNPSLSTF